MNQEEQKSSPRPRADSSFTAAIGKPKRGSASFDDARVVYNSNSESEMIAEDCIAVAARHSDSGSERRDSGSENSRKSPGSSQSNVTPKFKSSSEGSAEIVLGSVRGSEEGK